MKMNVYFALLFSVAFIFSSCGKNELDELPIDAEETCDFKYGDTYYRYNPKVLDEAATVFNELNENPSLATFVKDDGTVEYFDSYADLVKSINEGNIEESTLSVSTRAYQWFKTNSATLKVYSEYSYVGDYHSFTIESAPGPWQLPITRSVFIPKLSELRPNLDRRISSMEVICNYTQMTTSWNPSDVDRPYVTFYDIENPDYEFKYPGVSAPFRSITYGVTLNKPPYGYVHKFNKHWNDATRSLRFFFSTPVPGAL